MDPAAIMSYITDTFEHVKVATNDGDLHPIYGRQSWMSVLNPTDATFEGLRPMPAEAYRLVVDQNARKGIAPT